MKTIISASRRTDIPAFYLDWFMSGIKAGGLSVHNPLYRKNVMYVNLSPQKVQWIVFWSRDYHKFLKHRSFFDSYDLFFHFTVTSFHPLLEKRHISRKKIANQAEMLADIYGGDHIVWRYDPIVFWYKGNDPVSNFNEMEFREYCRLFSELGIHRCYFSFVTHYAKFVRRFRKKYPDLRLVQPDQTCINRTLEAMKKNAAHHRVELFSCCNKSLVNGNVLEGSCISGTLLNNLSGQKVVSGAKTATRKDCGCTRSVDIGDYVMQPCYFGCLYCYANPVWR